MVLRMINQDCFVVVAQKTVPPAELESTFQFYLGMVLQVYALMTALQSTTVSR